MRADLTRLKALYGIQWFTVDYMGLLGDGQNLDETERSALISRNLKLTCRALGLSGLIIQSMNKAGIAATVPGQASLSGSASLPFDADMICFLTEFVAISQNDGFIKKEDTVNMRTLHWAKGRELENPRKYMHLVKRPGFPAFGDYVGDK